MARPGTGGREGGGGKGTVSASCAGVACALRAPPIACRSDGRVPRSVRTDRSHGARPRFWRKVERVGTDYREKELRRSAEPLRRYRTDYLLYRNGIRRRKRKPIRARKGTGCDRKQVRGIQVRVRILGIQVRVRILGGSKGTHFGDPSKGTHFGAVRVRIVGRACPAHTYRPEALKAPTSDRRVRRGRP